MFKTGWKDFNELMGDSLKEGNVILIGSPPHNYKSTFSIGLIQQIIRHSDLAIPSDSKDAVMIASSENDRDEVALAVAYQLECVLSRADSTMNDDEVIEYLQTYLDEKRMDLWLSHHNKNTTENLIDIRNDVLKASKTQKVRVVVLDMIINDGLVSAMKTIREMAKELNVLIIVAHPTYEGRWSFDTTDRKVGDKMADAEIHLSMERKISTVDLKVSREADFITLPISSFGIILDDA